MLRFCSMILLSIVCGLGPPAGEVSAPAQPQIEESAGFLFEGREYIVEGGQERGPWLYESERITVLVNRVSWHGKQCYVADVRLRDGNAFRRTQTRPRPDATTEMPYKIARRYEAVLRASRRTSCAITRTKGRDDTDGKVYYDGRSADMLPFLRRGMDYLGRERRRRENARMGASDVFAFGPILIEDGEINPKINSHPLRPGNYRTGIGLVEQGHAIAVVTADVFTFR